MRTFWMLALTAVFAIPAFGNEATIRKVLESKLGGAKIEGVERGPLGLWEVRFRGEDGVHILYTDAAATHIIVGKIYETKADKDVTEARLRKLNAINFSSLPLSQAVKVQRGNGKRTLVIFSDPHCPACKQFEKVLATVDDITIHYFMYPVIRPELADQSRAVWCAPDRSKAWLDLALRGKPIPGAPKCESAPIDKVVELGSKLGIRSTPTMFLATGERLRGGTSAAELKAMLDEAASQKKK